MFSKSQAYQIIAKNLWKFEDRKAEEHNSQPFRDSMDFWNKGKFNQEWKVGAVVAFLNKKNPSTRPEFARQYLNELRSEAQVVKMVEEFAAKGGLTFEVALNWWWIRVMDQSFTGWHGEGRIFDMMKIQLAGSGNDVRKATDEEDRKFGVDLIVFNIASGEIVEGYQIKPGSYFTGQSYSNKLAREKTNPDKYKLFKQVTGASVRYIHLDDSLKFGYPIFQNTFKSFKTANRFEKFSR